MQILDRIADLLVYNPQAPMLFNSGLFLVLFLLFIPLYYLLREKRTLRFIYVVLFSLYFYYKSSGYYALLIVLTATVDYLLAQRIYGTENEKHRELFLWLSVLFNLGMLGYFKYTNFLLDVFGPLFHALASWVGIGVGASTRLCTSIFCCP